MQLHLNESSKIKLGTCDKRIIRVVSIVAKEFNCIVLNGHITEQKHLMNIVLGRTSENYYESKHSFSPSLAIDILPVGNEINEEIDRAYFAGYFIAVGMTEGIKIKWGYHEYNHKNKSDIELYMMMAHFELCDIKVEKMI